MRCEKPYFAPLYRACHPRRATRVTKLAGSFDDDNDEKDEDEDEKGSSLYRCSFLSSPIEQYVGKFSIETDRLFLHSVLCN